MLTLIKQLNERGSKTAGQGKKKRKEQDNLTEAYISRCSTPKPKEFGGLNFLDIYLDPNLNEAAKSKENNCYIDFPYKLKVTDAECKAKRGITFKELVKEVQTIWKQIYYKNEDMGKLKLAALSRAMKGLSAAHRWLACTRILNT